MCGAGSTVKQENSREEKKTTGHGVENDFVGGIDGAETGSLKCGFLGKLTGECVGSENEEEEEDETGFEQNVEPKKIEHKHGSEEHVFEGEQAQNTVGRAHKKNTQGKKTAGERDQGESKGIDAEAQMKCGNVCEKLKGSAGTVIEGPKPKRPKKGSEADKQTHLTERGVMAKHEKSKKTQRKQDEKQHLGEVRLG